MSRAHRRCAHVRIAKLAVGVLAAASAIGARAQDPHAREPTVLRDGQTLTAAHRAADRFTYVVDVPDAEAYLLRVDQRGLDLIVTLEAPNGVETEFNSPLLRDGSEFVVLAPNAPGRYRISVHSEEHTGAPAGHSVSLSRLTPSADADEVEAWRQMSAGAAANAAAHEEGWSLAVGAYQRAADIWRKLGRTREQAEALFAVATIEYWQRFNWERSAEIAATAGGLYERVGEAALAANAVHLQAAALVESALETKQSSSSADVAPETEAMFTEVFELLERARATHERLGNVYDLGLVTNNFGYTYYYKGEHSRARPYYERAAALFRGIDEWRGELNPLQNLALLDAQAGHLAAAAETLERILEVLPEGMLMSYRADALTNLGATERMLGYFEEALGIFSAVLEIQRELEDRQGEGRALSQLGETYFSLGELDLATEYLQVALPIAIASNDGRTQEATLRALANVAYLQRDYAAALAQHKYALEVSASIFNRAQLQRLIARDLIALGRFDEAEKLAEDAVASALNTRSDSQLARALHESGRARLLAGDPEAALPKLERAEDTFERLNMRAERADVLHSLALAARAQSRFTDAVALGEATLAELEKQRLRVADPELRAFFSAARRDYYETQIDSLMTLQARSGNSTDVHSRAALETSERSRSRLTADLLQEASVDVRADFDPRLQERESELYARLAEARHQRDILLEQGAADLADGALQDAVAVLAAVENELNLLEIELRRGHPQLATLSAPTPLTVEQIQASLGDDTALVQYALGAARSYAWIVTRERVSSVELAGRAAIESVATRALESLRTYSAPGTESAVLAELAELVLDPVSAALDERTIVLALDGALQYVPFSVLPARSTSGATVPLLAEHDLVSIPSMSTLAVPVRANSGDVAKTLAVFADPVLEADDPRFGGVATSPASAVASPMALVTRSATNLGRLISTGHEAEAIASLVPEDHRLVARGFSASREAVLTADLDQYRYVHFATHGLVDSRYPGLSALTLSRFDDRGSPQNGDLRLNDIYALDLRADLVVLSACETALGRDMRGEGLLGLTQGFLYAGARSVVASLWPVPDRATAELMTRFYGYMLNDGMRPVEALRQAQLASAANRRWSDPYFWGGFVLVGDWR